MNKDEMHKILAVELIPFAQVTVTPAYSGGWYNYFSNVPASQFAMALQQAVMQSTSGFPPTPGQVNAVLKTFNALPEDLETADQAWDLAWSGKPCSARAQEAARLMGDWDKRFMWLLDSLPFKRKDFSRIYEGLKQREQSEGVQVSARAMLNNNQKSILNKLGLANGTR